jgi:hypothetical protein
METMKVMYIYVEHVDEDSNSINKIDENLIHYKVAGCKKEIEEEEFWDNVYDNFKVLYPNTVFIIKYEDQYKVYSSIYPEVTADIIEITDDVVKKFEKIHGTVN